MIKEVVPGQVRHHFFHFYPKCETIDPGRCDKVDRQSLQGA
jgi:hypothetical protein